MNRNDSSNVIAGRFYTQTSFTPDRSGIDVKY